MIPIKVRPGHVRSRGRISVVLPSRKRPDMLKRSLNSLIGNSVGLISQIEVLVAYDPDDFQTWDAALHSDFVIVKGWCAPGRYGYGGIANYYPPLLQRAQGEWVLFWGDDAIMQTPGWDDIVRSCPPSVLYTRGNPDGHNCFPIVHMDILETVGRFPQLPAVDTWWDEVGRMSGRWLDTDITILQDRPDLTGKEPDQTYIEGRPGYRSQEYYNLYWTAMRREDAMKVLIGMGPLGMRAEAEFWLGPVTDVEKTMAEFGFAGFDDILKHTDDLVRYDRVINEDKPEVIVEAGTRNGASARWLAANYNVDVITIDIAPVVPAEWLDEPSRITYIQGNSIDVEVINKVRELVGARRCMVVLDSDHTRAHVYSEMVAYSTLVTPGCHMVVEDGIFRHASPHYWIKHNFGNPSLGNPLDAIEDFMRQGMEKTWKRDLKVESMTPVTHHVAGWWKRLGAQ